MTAKLAGRIALVTGGRKGIGRAICLELGSLGADVALVTGNDLPGSEATAAEVRALGVRCEVFSADVSSKASVDAMVADVIARLGLPDIVVNNAGFGKGAPLLEVGEADWDKVFAVNTKGTFLTSAAVARGLVAANKPGAIVNIIAASGQRSFPGSGGYSASKAAAINFTVQASLEWARYGIRVNAVSPGAIRDPGTGWEQAEPHLIKEVARIPLKKAGRTVDIAKAVSYLASDDADYVTGQTLVVDGGGVNTWHLSAPLWEE